MKKLLLLAIVLRLLVAGLLFHPDIKIYNFQSSFLSRGILDIYSYLIENKKTLPFKEEFAYFPLTYFAIGGYQWMVSPILGNDFDSWLNNASSGSVVKDPNIFRYLIVLKFPYLILDILIAFLLKKYFDDKKKGEKAFTLWLFNPFTIVLIYAFSNVEIFAVALTLIALLLTRQKRFLLASGVLALSAGFKVYPVLLIPFLFLKGKDLKEKTLIILVPILTLAAIILPFWSSLFVQSALISGWTTRIANPNFVIVTSILFFYAWIIDRKIKLFNYWFIILLFIFSFSHFHIAWLLWVAPFIVILAIKKPVLSTFFLFITILAFLIPMLYNDKSMTISLFRIYSTWYDLLPTPFSVIEKFYDPVSLQTIIQSALAGGSLVFAYKLLGRDKT
ncbi:MAG: hypothetical protein AAB535_00420 [Patescibacteria group bacterium]